MFHVPSEVLTLGLLQLQSLLEARRLQFLILRFLEASLNPTCRFVMSIRLHCTPASQNGMHIRAQAPIAKSICKIHACIYIHAYMLTEESISAKKITKISHNSIAISKSLSTPPYRLATLSTCSAIGYHLIHLCDTPLCHQSRNVCEVRQLDMLLGG